jgi:hypothetical protein
LFFEQNIFIENSHYIKAEKWELIITYFNLKIILNL